MDSCGYDVFGHAYATRAILLGVIIKGLLFRAQVL
jgi:hypothetical protein